MKRRVRRVKIQTKAKCVECSRIFDLLDEEQAGEWYYGHDCEPREEGGE
jgi:NOL1/NOP2/fmu family ribosome biogenesis protein